MKPLVPIAKLIHSTSTHTTAFSIQLAVRSSSRQSPRRPGGLTGCVGYLADHRERKHQPQTTLCGCGGQRGLENTERGVVYLADSFEG